MRYLIYALICTYMNLFEQLREIEESWEVDYVKFRVPVFKCKLVDSNTGVHVDDLVLPWLILQR